MKDERGKKGMGNGRDGKKNMMWPINFKLIIWQTFFDTGIHDPFLQSIQVRPVPNLGNCCRKTFTCHMSFLSLKNSVKAVTDFPIDKYDFSSDKDNSASYANC